MRRILSHLTQGTRPSKKITNAKDVKRYLNVASIARDGLLVVRRNDPLSPARDCIIVPRMVLDGLVTALHIQLDHPSCYQLKQVMHRYLYALDLDKAIDTASRSCHQCASLRDTPHTTIPQSTGNPPEVVGISYAADVIKREKQLILVLRECVTSYTASCVIDDERRDTLRDSLVKLCIGLRPLDGPPAVIRNDPAAGFAALVKDALLSTYRLTIELRRVKNVNKNPVAEKAVRELEHELLHQQPTGGAVTQLVLSIVTANLNTRIRNRGFSARELWTQRDQFTNEQLPLTDYDLIRQLKESITSTPILALFDAKQETTLSADASSHGLGAVLLQRQPDGKLQPVAYASRSMSSTEQRYAQIEKEALATTWACERFSDFLLGKTFHVETDHKPLVSLLGQKTLDQLPPRIQRFRMRLMRFNYSIAHVAGKDLITADTLSRAPIVEHRQPQDVSFEQDCQAYVNAVLKTLPITEKRLLELKQAQVDDATCQRIQTYCQQGWPDRARLRPDEKVYLQVAAELTVQQGLLLKGSRLVIPLAMRPSILEKIHEGHQGITKCRERAKQSVWWPGLSKQIEDLVESCDRCAKERVNQAEPMIPSDVPERPWQKVGSDLFELNGSPYLLVVDYLSAFVEISKLSSTTSASIVNHMTSMFARHGVPEVVVTDNGPQYASDTFRRFAAARGFLHTTSSPRFPQSNGEAERAVKTLKCLLAKSDNPYDTLLAYRSTPLSNGYSPAELLMGRKLRTPIPTIPALLEPLWSHLRGARKSRLEIKNRQKK